jgi:hypothetical protein
MLQGPRAPYFIVYAVASAFSAAKLRRPRELDGRFVKKICKSLHFGKYAERWLWIRARALQDLKIPFTYAVLRADELSAVTARFAAASASFDRIIRSHRHSRTIRPWGRSNFLNYNFVLHCLLDSVGPTTRAAIDAHFVFPLLRTPRVLERLYSMWTLICDDLGWNCPPLEHILNAGHPKEVTL